MRKPPFNRPAFSGAFGKVFGKVFGAEGGEFSPLSIPGLQAWYDAFDKDTITSSLGLVSSWSDKSGNGNTVSASGSARPETQMNNINGLNTIAFDGMDDFLELDTFAPTFNFTVACVFEVLNVTSGNDGIISFQDNLAGNDDFQIDAGLNPDFFFEFDNSGLGVPGEVNFPGNLVGVPSALMYRLEFIEVGDSSVILFDSSGERDSDLNNYNGDLSNDQSFKIGVNRGAGQFLQVNIGEIVIVNRAITAQDRTDLFNYFSNKWGV